MVMIICIIWLSIKLKTDVSDIAFENGLETQTRETQVDSSTACLNLSFCCNYDSDNRGEKANILFNGTKSSLANCSQKALCSLYHFAATKQANIEA